MRFFFTFGVNHAYANKFVEIEADSYAEAREVMLETHLQKWAFQYSEKDFEGQTEEFNYTRLALIKKNEFGNWRAE